MEQTIKKDPKKGSVGLENRGPERPGMGRTNEFERQTGRFGRKSALEVPCGPSKSDRKRQKSEKGTTKSDKGSQIVLELLHSQDMVATRLAAKADVHPLRQPVTVGLRRVLREGWRGRERGRCGGG